MYRLDSDDTPQQIQHNLHVVFYPGSRPNNFRSGETGKPEFDNVDFIRKVAGGNPNNVIERPVTDQDKREFPVQWAAYQSNQTFRPANGTLLEDWPRLDAATRAKLKSLEFHTVEQLAEASDAQITSIGMGCYELQKRAQAFIAAAKDSAFVQRQADELVERNQELSDLKTTLSQALAQINELKVSKDSSVEKRQAAELLESQDEIVRLKTSLVQAEATIEELKQAIQVAGSQPATGGRAASTKPKGA